MAQTTETRPLVVTPTSQRAGGIAGIVFAVLLAVDLFLPYVSFTDPVADIREFFVDNGTAIIAVAWAEAILFAFVFLFFAACLRDTLAWSETVPTEFPRLTFAGGIVAATIGGIAALPAMTLAFSEAAVDDRMLVFLLQMEAIAYGFLIGFAFALMAVAASIVILRTAVLARWLGWLGLVSAVLLVVGALWLIDGDETGPLAIVEYTGLILWLVWALGVGIDMVRRSRTA